jgi:putative methyltransferase (TIGR04325 family)
VTHSATSRPYKGFQASISNEGTKQRSRREILAAFEDGSLASKARKKELVKALLEAGPLSFLATLAKPIPGARRFLSQCLPSSLKYRGVYFSFEDARAHAPKDVPLGYDHHEIASGYKDQRFLSSDYPAAFWLRQALRDGATVFDLGGSVGISFYTWENYFSYPGNLRWVVCDVPAVIQAGEKIARERNEKRLHFTWQLEDADGCNCLLASGSLQYIESSLADSLKRLAHQPRHLIINRIPLHSTKECITLQNVRWAVSPYRVFHGDAFIAGCESLGYSLVDAWTVADHHCWIPLYPEFSVSAYSGLYFRKQGESTNDR